MRRYGLWFLPLGCLAFADGVGWLAQAGTISGGTAVTLGGLDSLANTVQEYLKGNVGKMLAIILAIAGIAMVVVGKMGLGIGGLGSGIAIAFVPNIIGDAFDATEAAGLVGMALPVLWASSDGILNLLARVGLVLLWPLVPALKYGRDPVVWLAVGVVVALRPFIRLRLGRLSKSASRSKTSPRSAPSWCSAACSSSRASRRCSA